MTETKKAELLNRVEKFAGEAFSRDEIDFSWDIAYTSDGEECDGLYLNFILDTSNDYTVGCADTFMRLISVILDIPNIPDCDLFPIFYLHNGESIDYQLD